SMKGLHTQNGLLPDALMQKISALVPSEERKRRWGPDDEPWPDELGQARELALTNVPRVEKINTAIVKRYRAGEPSGAYELHKDPIEFLDNPLLLFTLSGSAEMTLRSGDEEERRAVSAGDLVVITDTSILHKVSPPLTPEPRELLFLGWSDAPFRN